VQLRPNGDPGSAIAPLEVALDIAPGHVRARRVYVETLKRLRVRRDDLVWALCCLGMALEMPGPDQDLLEAVKAYHEPVTLEPNCRPALLKLGDLKNSTEQLLPEHATSPEPRLARPGRSHD